MLASTRKQPESFVRYKKQKLVSLTKQKVTLFCIIFPNTKIMETKTKTIMIQFNKPLLLNLNQNLQDS